MVQEVKPYLLKHLHHHGGQLALASGRAEAVVQYAALPTKNPRRNKKYLETTQRPEGLFIGTVRPGGIRTCGPGCSAPCRYAE